MEQSSIGIKNSFGSLKRIIVGIIDGAIVPEVDISILATMPKEYIDFFDKNKGKPFPKKYIKRAKNELNNLTKILESKGIIVDRPKKIDFSKPIITPHWKTTGLYAAMPRDILLVVGTKIIVAPMSWRCRYREIEAYEDLLESYKSMGYEIIFPPKPKLKDTLYKKNIISDGNSFVSILTEIEPVFDAADFIVIDKIIIGQESHVTNKSGIEWLKNTLGKDYEMCTIKTNDNKPMHIDATIIPLKEGLFLVNPERIDKEKLLSQLPNQFKTWKVIEAPKPVTNENDPPKYMSSDWLSMNIITLDSNTVLVEESQEPLAKLLEKHDFKVIRIPFKNFQCFGGSFHCATQEVIREKV